ncbi:MAG: hydantoinase/oxoprolinase family protein, partial [Bacilli bacterium]
KTFTTKNIVSGISKALKTIVIESKIDPSCIKHAMLGTTQCTNAIVQRQNLKKVITIRLASNTTQAIKPFCNWPKDAQDIINEASYIVDGGYEYDGRELKPLSLNQIKEIVLKHQDSCHNYAISCVFSPVNSDHEQQVKKLILELDPQAYVSISSEIGTLSLLERENATILNSALSEVIKDVVAGFKQALITNNINVNNIYLCQNDGTLMAVDYALLFPVLTIASGPTNSIRGGVYLSALENTMIIDVGGTTSDIGVVTKGFPRETTLESNVGGISTNFRMPDIISIAIGGGTIIEINDENIKVGPESVGYQLQEKALIYGGKTITLSDVAHKLGFVSFASHPNLELLSKEDAQNAMDIVNDKIEAALDLLSFNNQKNNLIIVGGGSKIIPQHYNNIDQIYTPEHFEVANAIGASIAKVSGSYEGLVNMDLRNRHEIINDCKEKAISKALQAGAIKETIEIVEVEEYPIAYHPANATRLVIKAVGTLDLK